MDKKKFDPKSFLNVKELTTQEELLIKGMGKDKKKDKKKDKQKLRQILEYKYLV